MPYFPNFEGVKSKKENSFERSNIWSWIPVTAITSFSRASLVSPLFVVPIHCAALEKPGSVFGYFFFLVFWKVVKKVSLM